MSNILNKFKAIKNLYSNAVNILENEDGTFTVKDINNNDVSIDISAVNTKTTELENAEATNKANGNQKLLDLGLTQAEATALTGYTPPSEE